MPRWAACCVSVLAFMAAMAAAGAPSVLLSYDQEAWGFSDGALTGAFAVYALTLLLALLTCGSLSDHLGRRPVAVGSLLLTALALLLFLRAHAIGDLVLARAVQGAAIGAATAALSASIVELAPERHRRLAHTAVSVTTAGGLGIGVVLAGIAIEATSAPNAVLFAVALAVVLVAAVLLMLSPETVSPRAGALASLVPRIRIPDAVRGQFLRLAPGIIAIWMSAGLILGLGGSLAGSVLHLGVGLPSALIVATQPLVATICTLVLAPRIGPRVLVPGGYVAVMLGVLAECASFATGDASLVVAGALVTGVGYGAVFSATLRILLPGVRPHERGGFFAAFYIVGYLAYGASALCAGLLSDLIGLGAAGVVYAVATVAAAALALGAWLLPARRAPRPQALAEQPCPAPR
ncbi:MFS transporter [Brachybacterium subflavum]|uniref:MFS transporter n=1 Tax=Brachybacterium subflavum TaxID=2585206 RepID=UPI00187A6A1D|nr:MFS transporter [Brachybacterium subflavum]